MTHSIHTPPKTAIITGASRGLGLGVAHSLALDYGLRVALVARERAPLVAAVEQIRAAGGEAIAIVADVSDKRAIHRIAGQAAAALGDIDVLVNNASSLGPTPLRPLLDSECEDFGEVLVTNLLAPFRLTKAVLGSMVLRGRGVVVQISSDAAVEAYPEWGMYGVSKAALDHLTRSWAAELDGSGVRMVSVDPGEMDTKMHADAIPDADPSTLADPFAVGRALAAIICTSETELIITADSQLRVVDGLLTGMHASHESHYRLLRAFAPQALLERAWDAALDAGYRSHEFGDLALLLPAHTDARTPS